MMNEKMRRMMYCMVCVFVCLAAFAGGAQGTNMIFTERPLYVAPNWQLSPRISGDRVVFTDFTLLYQEIFVADVNTGDYFNLTNTPDQSEELSDISGDLVVYTIFRANGDGDVAVLDVSLPIGSPPVALIASPYLDRRPRIYGRRLVYEHYRGDSFDIYGYDLDVGSSFPVDTSPNNHYNPSISADYIVYEDRTTGEVLAFNHASGPYVPYVVDQGFEPDVDGDYMVYAKKMGGLDVDVMLCRMEPPCQFSPCLPPVSDCRNITNRPGYQGAPKIFGNYVIYDDESAGNYDVYLYLIDTDETFQVTSHSADQFISDVGDGHIVYNDNRNGNLDIYVTDFVINSSPTANAGMDQTVHAGTLVTLDGSGSADPEGHYPLTYAWEVTAQPAGSTASL